MPFIEFPDVPDVLGVPPLPRLSGSPIVTSLLGAAQGALFRAFQTSSKWGIYNADGEPLGDRLFCATAAVRVTALRS